MRNVTQQDIDEIQGLVDRTEKMVDDMTIGGAIVNQGWFRKPIVLQPIPAPQMYLDLHEANLRLLHEYKSEFEKHTR